MPGVPVVNIATSWDGLWSDMTDVWRTWAVDVLTGGTIGDQLIITGAVLAACLFVTVYIVAPLLSTPDDDGWTETDEHECERYGARVMSPDYRGWRD